MFVHEKIAIYGMYDVCMYTCGRLIQTYTVYLGFETKNELKLNTNIAGFYFRKIHKHKLKNTNISQ